MRDLVMNGLGAIPDRLMSQAFLLERQARRVSRQDYLAELDFYLQPEFRKQKAFFQYPRHSPALYMLGESACGEGSQKLYRYTSSHHPHHPAVAQRLDQHVANRHGYLLLWQHATSESGQRPPLVICVHGFRMGHPRRAQAMFRIRRLFDMGMDVALFIQPHHWRRASPGLRQHFFVGEDIPLTIENVAQQQHDLRSCHLALQDMGYHKSGFIGGSLGGLAVILYAAHHADQDFVFSVVPAIRMDGHLDPARTRLPFGKDADIREKTFRVLDLIDPSFYQCRMDLAHFGVVYHQGDRINDARFTRQWVSDWQVRHVWSIPGGHWLVFGNHDRGHAWYGWLQQHGFVPARN